MEPRVRLASAGQPAQALMCARRGAARQRRDSDCRSGCLCAVAQRWTFPLTPGSGGSIRSPEVNLACRQHGITRISDGLPVSVPPLTTSQLSHNQHNRSSCSAAVAGPAPTTTNSSTASPAPARRRLSRDGRPLRRRPPRTDLVDLLTVRYLFEPAASKPIVSDVYVRIDEPSGKRATRRHSWRGTRLRCRSKWCSHRSWWAPAARTPPGRGARRTAGRGPRPVARMVRGRPRWRRSALPPRDGCVGCRPD